MEREQNLMGTWDIGRLEWGIAQLRSLDDEDYADIIRTLERIRALLKESIK